MMQWPCYNPDLYFFSRRRILMKIQYALPLVPRHLHHFGKAAIQATLKAVRLEPSSLWPPLGISQWRSVACLFSLDACYKSCCLQRSAHALVRHISARAGQQQSGHGGKAGAGDYDHPRKPSDFVKRRKQPSPGPLTGLYLHRLSSRLPRRKVPGFCYFLNHICYVVEDKMVKESELPAAQHRQL